ncbi:MAG: cell envelope biogenesis protein OmpA [Gammaproteobacteria bacterium SG8_31]|jgi:outer membrane protein OmpA-like peptidoglycan-associated protein|nr:MAG: cell envelope biogenesis protein OmpA [Gammaproteobacteria bacterium SG8_31]
MKTDSNRTCRLAIATLVAATIIVSGCETLNPYTDEPETSRTAKGAGIGAAAGAVAGIVVGGSRKATILGAGIGALIGAGVGNYMDREAEALRQRLRATGVSVTRSGDQIILNMPGNVTFATDSADISSSFYAVLDSVAIVLNDYEKTYVDVVGHTDSTGRADYNQQLSVRRAQSVADYLMSREVIPERLVVTGRGQTQPIASNETPEGRALNRRVEIVLTPLT